MKKTSILMIAAIAAASFSCTQKEQPILADLNNDGIADIKYTSTMIEDLNDADEIKVDGTVVTNTASNETWTITDRKQFETTFDVVAENVNAAAEKVEAGVEQAGEAVEGAVEEVGEAVETGAEKAGEMVEEGAEAVGEALEEGAAATKATVKEGVNKVGQEVEKVGEKLQSSTEKK